MLDCAIIVEDQVTIYGIVRPRRGTTMDPEIEGEVGLVGIREVVDLIEIEGGDSEDLSPPFHHPRQFARYLALPASKSLTGTIFIPEILNLTVALPSLCLGHLLVH
jgi:hypothetical protein